jgi:hypothetical protein
VDIPSPGAAGTDSSPITIALTAAVPAGFTASFSPASLTAAGASTLTLAADKTVRSGIYTIKVIGKGKGVTLTTKITVAVALRNGTSKGNIVR